MIVVVVMMIMMVMIMIMSVNFHISYLEHETNDLVRSMINLLAGPQEPLLATVKRRKLAWFGHVTCHYSLSKTILQGTLERGERSGQQRKRWVGNIPSLPMLELRTRASFRKHWKRISAESSLLYPKDPISQGTELN